MKQQNVDGSPQRFVLEEYFHGRTRAWGIFEDRAGRLRRQFVVDIEGRWDGGTLTLDERFRYADGAAERRMWTIRKRGERAYEGRADDVVGVARGTVRGTTLNWRYRLDVAVGRRSWRLHFDDRMFLQPDGILINRATVSKFGITVGRVTIVFRKPAGARPAVADMHDEARRSTRH